MRKPKKPKLLTTEQKIASLILDDVKNGRVQVIWNVEQRSGSYGISRSSALPRYFNFMNRKQLTILTSLMAVLIGMIGAVTLLLSIIFKRDDVAVAGFAAIITCAGFVRYCSHNIW